MITEEPLARWEATQWACRSCGQYFLVFVDESDPSICPWCGHCGLYATYTHRVVLEEDDDDHE